MHIKIYIYKFWFVDHCHMLYVLVFYSRVFIFVRSLWYFSSFGGSRGVWGNKTLSTRVKLREGIGRSQKTLNCNPAPQVKGLQTQVFQSLYLPTIYHGVSTTNEILVARENIERTFCAILHYILCKSSSRFIP